MAGCQGTLSHAKPDLRELQRFIAGRVEYGVRDAPDRAHALNLGRHGTPTTAVSCGGGWGRRHRRAADKISLIPPAVSHQIKALEDELGLCPLERQARSIQLAPVSVTFLREASLLAYRFDCSSCQ